MFKGNRMKKALLIFHLFLLTGCIPYPARVVMPLKTQVVDAESGTPIEGAQVLRIVCDVHDMTCKNAKMDRGQSDNNGNIKMEGERKWGLWFPAPGGFPVPNHRIAIWKSGYQAFVFSQYGSIDDIKSFSKREDLKSAIREVPLERKECGADAKPEEMFSGGKIGLLRVGK
jgi:hypothetical protein